MVKSQRKNFSDKYRAFFLSVGLLLMFLHGDSQTYSPGSHVVVNDAIAPAQAVPSDSRAQFYDASNFVYRDYNGPTEVLTYLNLGKYRFGHFPIYVHLGGSLSGGAWTGGITQTYWFKNGTADSNLVRWYTDSTAAGIGTVTNVSATNSTGYTWTISNPTTIPNIVLVLNAAGDLTGVWPNITAAKFNGQLPSFYLNYNNLTNKPVGLSLTTTGTSGVATYNSGTGILNIPNYAVGGSACLNCNADTIGNIPINFTQFPDFGALILDSVNGQFIIAPKDSIWRVPGVDSIKFRLHGIFGQILDSLGSGSSAVNSVSNSDGSLTITPTTGVVVASLNLGHANTWGVGQTFNGSTSVFNGGMQIGSTVAFAADNTYTIGSPTVGAQKIWSRQLSSPAALVLSSSTGSSVSIAIGASTAFAILSTGQAQLNNYTTSTSFTGTPLAFLQTDASGNIIQIPIASVQGALANEGVGYRFFDPTNNKIKTLTCTGCTLDSATTGQIGITVTGGGSGNTNSNVGSGFRWAIPNTNNVKTVFGSLIIWDSTTNANALTATADTTSGNQKLATQGFVGRQGFINLAALSASSPLAYNNTTGAFSIQVANTSQNGYLSSTDWNIFNGKQAALTLTTTGSSGPATLIGATLNIPQYAGGGGGITQIKAKNPLFTVGTDSIALDTLRAPEIPYGNIYTRNSNFGSNEFLAVGNAVFSINAAGNIDLTSANSGTNSNYVRSQNLVDEVTQLPRYSRSMSFQAVNTGSGIALGTVKTGVRQSVGDVAAWVNLSASPMQVAIGNTSPTILTNSGSYTNGPTWTAGDSIQVTLTFSDSVAVATFKNISTNSATTTLTYNFVTSSSPFLPQISYWAYITFGGHQIVYSEADSSASVKNPNELFAGTSKTAAYYATNFANRFGWQVGQSVPSSVISAGGSNMTNDYSRVFPQNLNQNPIYFLIEEPCNDARVGYGGSVSQAEKTVDSMIAVCRTRGIKFFLYGLPEDSTVTGPAGNASIGLTVMDLYFRNKYPQNYINTWDSLVVTPGSDNRLKTAYYITDGIHPNGAAQTVIARIVARSLKYYKDRQANILNTDGLIQVSQGGYASINTKAVAAAIVGGGAVNVLPKYLASGGLTPSGFSDDGSTEFGAGSWYTTPVLKAGPSHVVTGSLYTMTFGSSFTNFFTKMPGGGTNDKIWGFNNNGGTFSGAKLTDGGSTAFTWLNVASSGTTLTSIALQGPTLVNGATSDGVDGFFGIGGGRFDKLGVNTTSVTDSWLILGAGSTTVSPIRFTVGPLKTTTFGGTLQYGVGADTSFYAGITRTALNVLTRIALVDSNGIKSGNIPFANTSRYYTESANFNFLSNSLQVGTSTAIASSIATFTSTTQGLLIPRMSTTQVNAISSPAEGLFAYDNVLHAPYYYNGTAWTAFGGGGSQTWQQALTTGSTLNTTNTVVNTGQIFTWNNGGTGTFKFSGILSDTTNAAYLLFKKKDSSIAEMTFANLAAYLPADTTIGMNGITILANASGTRDTLIWNGTLSQTTTIAMNLHSVTFSGSNNFAESFNVATNGTINFSPLYYTNISTGGVAEAGYVVDIGTNGGSLAMDQFLSNVIENPAALIAAYTINLPALTGGLNGLVVRIHFGGTVSSGPVITTLTISPAVSDGSSIIQSTTPAAAVAGDCLIYRAYINGGTKIWYREH